MSRFFWFANVLFRLSCNSPHKLPPRTYRVHVLFDKLGLMYQID